MLKNNCILSNITDISVILCCVYSPENKCQLRISNNVSSSTNSPARGSSKVIPETFLACQTEKNIYNTSVCNVICQPSMDFIRVQYIFSKKQKSRIILNSVGLPFTQIFDVFLVLFFIFSIWVLYPQWILLLLLKTILIFSCDLAFSVAAGY